MKNETKKPKVRPLTKKEIIKFCDITIKKLEISSKKNTDNELGSYLCDSLTIYLNNLDILDSKKEKSYYIPKFTNDNAVKYCNGWESNKFNPWWSGNLDMDGFDYNNRIEFLKWIKSYYVNKKNFIQRVIDYIKNLF